MRALRLVLLGLASLGAPALAAPPAPAPAGLSSGPVRVTAGGEVRHGERAIGRIPLPRPPLKLFVREPVVAGHKLLHVVVAGAAGRASELLLTAPPELKLLFSGSTGPQDVDGEWSRHLRVDAKGVLLFQRREGLLRCDAQPVYLFPELYDFQARRFRPVSAAVSTQGLPELRAGRRLEGAPAGEPMNTFHLTGTSTQLGDEQRAANLSAPSAADDGRADTAWAESLGGHGRGEFLTAQAQPSPYRLKALRIIPGEAASAKAFREANRLKSAVLHLAVPRAAPRSYRILFPRDPAAEPGGPGQPYWVLLPEPVETTCATLVIDEVYRGAGARADEGRTAIAELRFFTELEFKGGLEQLARDLDAADERRGAAAVSVLIRLGAPGVEVASALPAGGPGLKRRVRVLAASRLPAAAAPLAKALPDLDAATRATALEGLAALGNAAVQPLAALLVSSEPGAEAARADAARALGGLGGAPARKALLEAAGRGPDAVRAGVVEGLGALRTEEDRRAVLQGLEDASPARRADLIHALGRLGRADPRAIAGRIASLWDRPGASFEERYRILTSVGRLAPETGLALFERASRSEDPVLRWTAVEQARRVPGSRPLPLFRRAVDDPYPPARIAAALGLVGRGSDAQASRALASRLQRERWPAVGLLVAEALASHCGPEGLAALRGAVARGPQGVDSRALHSLARCDPPGVSDELLGLARDPARRTSLRTQALALLGPVRASARVAQLVRLFEDLRTDAARSDAAEAVAISAAGALAVAAGAPAVEALADALALDPHEPIRAAAAMGLGRLCASAGREALERARNDSSSVVQRPAREALKRCNGRWK